MCSCASQRNDAAQYVKSGYVRLFDHFVGAKEYVGALCSKADAVLAFTIDSKAVASPIFVVRYCTYV
jgi:hypothetical protein